jgi:tRNA threonylcarbamoyladenosine biosynthesis protein TsaE
MSEAVMKSYADGQAWVKSNSMIWSSPGIILLNGPMGAGKTQIARWILTELGSNEAASPTFAIHHRYDTAKFPVDHYDLYRMESDFDLDNTTFWDMINETDNLVLVE